MKKLNKISLIGAVGGSMFIADNVFNIGNNQVSALTQETSDRLRAQRIAATLTPSINLLLLHEDELAADDSYTAQQNTLLSVSAAAGVLANDNALASSTLSLLQDVSSGTLTLNADGSFEYLPDIDFTGADSFTYRLTTTNGQSDDATVNIRVNGTPEAFDDDYLLATNALFQDNVIVNVVGGSDTILDGAQVVEVVNEATALGGTVSIQANGDFQYTPPSNLGNQQDSFVYTLQDNDGETDTATITWQIGVSFGGLDLPFTVAENLTLDSQFTVNAPNGLQSLEVNGASFSLSTLNAASLASPLPVPNTQFGGLIITGFDEMSGVVSFSFDPTGTAQDHTGVTNDALREIVSIRATDSGITMPFDAQLTIDVTDTKPVANNDARSMNEGISAIAGNTVGVAGAAVPGDVADNLIDPNPSPVTDVDFGAADGTPGSNILGNFGTFVISNAGVYTYTLDNALSAVQGLQSGESVTDVFTYTITDGDGDTASANVTVTINGVEDAAPTITVADLNGADAGQQSVTEASGDSVNGTVTINADAGVKTLTIGGQDVTDATNNTVTITGSDGNLQVTTFNPATGILSYTYTEDGAADDHSTAAVNDQFSIEVSDNEDDSASDTLSITIDDTQPTAVADTNSVTEDAADTTATGNLFTNDSQGADTPLVINGLAAGNSQQNTGMYGDLTINADGNYSYVLSNGDASVQALRSGQQLVDTFSYSITDTDGDTSSSSLIVTILGVDEPPAISITDTNGSLAGDESVAESETTTNSSFVINAEAGLASSGTALQITDEQSDVLSLTSLQLQNLATSNQTLIGVDGTVVLNGYSNTSDDFTINYSFDPTGTNRDHSGGDQSVVEMFSIVATDDLNRSTQAAILDILITDTAPTAAMDNASITEDALPNTVTGDVTTNDTTGSDTAISVSGVDFNRAQTVGTPFSSDYGTLDLNSDGTYTYTLDNGNNTVQELDSGESLTESFSYTITDTDGDESTTSLTVTINGADEPPSIVIPDVNGAGALGDLSVQEDQTVSGTFTVNSASGLNASGTALSITTDGATTNLTLAQLQGLGATPVTINDANDGDFTLTGYSSAEDHHTIAYSFDPTGTNRDHSGGDRSVLENFSITATDTSNRSNAPDVLDILITDTNPVANNDSRSMIEGTSAIAGNAVGTAGAAIGDVADNLIDPNANPVTDIDFGATDVTPGSNIAGDFGTFVINSAGVYTYTLDNALPAVQGLSAGESLADVFTYTITDGDGDTDTANITVTINGLDDSLPTVTISDSNGGAAGDLNVLEGSGASANGTANVTASAGVKSVSVEGQDVTDASTTSVTVNGTDGVLEVTAFNPSTGLLSYNYTENGTPNNHTAGAITDQFTITATDNEDDTASDTLVVSIDDTNATAVADTGNVTEDAAPNVITGNVFDNDTGADNRTVTQLDFSGGSQIIGSQLTTVYGDFVILNDGSYTYTLDNADSDTNALMTGEAPVETFTYILTDTDGDTSTSTVAITINGVDG